LGDPSLLHFTGKERDDEDDMVYFGARFYDPNQPRFMSADWADKPEAVPYSDLADPQSLNLYTYVRNNPVSRTDPQRP
jgi:RHS repeat-associated protein